MQEESKTVDPWGDAPGTGILGRLGTVLKKKGYVVNSVSVDNPSIAVEPEASPNSPVPLIVSRWGVSQYDRKHSSETFDMKTHTDELNAASTAYSNIFAKAWSRKLTRGICEAEALKAQLDGAELADHWPESLTSVDRGFEMLSKLISMNDRRGTDREFFYVSNGGWDHHSNLKDGLNERFPPLNQGLRSLVTELKEQGKWDGTVIVLVSEFSRTLNGNSGAGSDHGWAGNYAIMGGAVKGKRILGTYPSDITEAGELNVGRGRLVPTTSWDSIFNGIVQWMGADSDSELDYCLPNRERASSGSTGLFTSGDLFEAFTRNLRGGEE